MLASAGVSAYSTREYVERWGDRELVGFFGRHRLKIYGYLGLALKDRTWDTVGAALEESRQDRLDRAEAGWHQATIHPVARSPLGASILMIAGSTDLTPFRAQQSPERGGDVSYRFNHCEKRCSTS